MTVLLALVAQFTLQTSDELDAASNALKAFRPEEAVSILERARGNGPYAWPDYVRLHELLGVAHAYLERRDDASRDFEMLLALDPSHALSYTLSPKATFLFEQVRRKRGEDPPPTVDVAWRRDLKVSDAVGVDVETVADPLSFLKRATLFTRERGTASWSSHPFALPVAGSSRHELLPLLDPAPTHDTALELYLVAYDDAGNEVLRSGTATHPREVPLRYQAPPAWYAHWWVPVIGAAVVAGAAAGIYAATRPLPTNVPSTTQ
jgi:tetratricopeptide (TPR) repeat protein